MKTILFIILLTIFPLAVFGQPENNTMPPTQTTEKAGIEEVYLAKDDGNGAAGEAVNKFKTTDVPIYCVVQLDSTAPATVKMIFVAVSVKGVKAETKVVATSYKTDGRQNRVNFTGKPDKNWTAGNYRVDIYLDDKLVQSKSFEIQTTATATGNPQINAFQTKPARRKGKN